MHTKFWLDKQMKSGKLEWELVTYFIQTCQATSVMLWTKGRSCYYLRAECSDRRRPRRRCFTTSKNDWSSADWPFRSSSQQKRSSSSMNGCIPSNVCRVAFIQQRLLPGGFGNLQVIVHWTATIILLTDTPCRLLAVHQRFRRTCCLHLQG